MHQREGVGESHSLSRAGDVWLLYQRELRSALREKNILLYSLLVPALLYPCILWLIFSADSLVRGTLEQTPSRVAMVGLPPHHARLETELVEAGEFSLTSRPQEESLRGLQQGRFDLVAVFQPGPHGEMGVRLVYDGSRLHSKIARDRMQQVLERYRDLRLEELARQLAAADEQLQLLWVKPVNHASESQVGRFLLSILLPMAMIVVMGMGGLYPAVDSTAGERERSTWETLLTTAASRDDVVLAKYLYVVSVIAFSGLLNLAALYTCVYAVLEPMEGVTISLPWSSLPVLLGGTLLLAMFMAAGMMVPASFARTFQQGQSLSTPFYAVTILPTVLVADPSVQFTTTLACIPVLNAALAFREAIAGHLLWPQLLISLSVLLLCVVVSLWVARRVLAYEDVVLGTYGGSFWTFFRQRLLKRS
ncbi:ABC transporter permease [bacterium CPR1]|nr:ABC transporter permease [bacterium CPR1]